MSEDFDEVLFDEVWAYVFIRGAGMFLYGADPKWLAREACRRYVKALDKGPDEVTGEPV